MSRAGPVLPDGETLLFSDTGQRRPLLWSFAAMFTAPALIVGGVGFAPEYLDSPWPAAITAAGLLLFFVPLDLFFLNWWLEDWRTVITERRVMQRRGPFGLRREELDLSRLEDIRHDWESGRLTLIGGGRTLTIRCDEFVAQEIMKALIEAQKANA